MFKRFLNARKRTPATEDQASLVRTARGHEDPAVRRDACRRLRDLSELMAIVTEDADAGVREIALGHYRNLLCGHEEQPVDIDLRLAAVAAQEDPRVLEYVAANAIDAPVRQAAIARVTNQMVLAGCAAHDALAANRAVAAALLEDRHALEQVARQVAKRDKNVYRLVRQKLKVIQEREELPRRARSLCDELCEKLERLGRFDTWSQDLALLAHLDRQWAEMEPHADPASRERYAALRTQFLDAYSAYREANAAQIAAEEARVALRAERRALLAELAEATMLDDEATIAEICARIGERWTVLDALPDAEQVALDRNYANLSIQGRQRRDALRARRKGNERLAKLKAAAEQLLAQAKPLEHKEIQHLIEQAGPALSTEGVSGAVRDGFEHVRKELEARLAKQRKHAAQRLQDLPARLAELEAHLTAGELKAAEPLLQSLQASVDLAQVSGLARGDYAPLAERLHALAPRVRELQHWRKWGTDQHRQGLQEAMEALATADMSLEAVTLRLHDLQMEWKGLDKGGGAPVNHALWERFHAASERVYERCRPYLEAQARELEANRVQREQVCQDLEDFLDKVDWARMDWKKAARAERETRRAWATLGQVEPRKRRALEKRFRTALARLDERLDAERARNLQFRESLIAQIEALVAEPDLEHALEQTKRLQREWHTSVPGRQREENRLWTRFRAACDAVFARRKEQQEAQHAALSAHLAAREAICAEALALAQSEVPAQDLASGLRDLEARWREAEHAAALPRQAAAGLAQRWREAREALTRARQERLAAVEKGQRDLLVGQARLCERLEQAVLDGTVEPELVDAVAAEWQAMGSLRDHAQQQAMAQRFVAALDAARDAGDPRAAFLTAIERNQRRRHALCLQLEVLAQVESPPELAKERMELQVARLSGRMAAGAGAPPAGAAQLLRDWYQCGPAPMDAALDARFERARAALEQAAGEPS
jgi:DNA repair protein SbcC/Rad50